MKCNHGLSIILHRLFHIHSTNATRLRIIAHNTKSCCCNQQSTIAIDNKIMNRILILLDADVHILKSRCSSIKSEYFTLIRSHPYSIGRTNNLIDIDIISLMQVMRRMLLTKPSPFTRGNRIACRTNCSTKPQVSVCILGHRENHREIYVVNTIG